jgi:AraC-like DNA-binding protein
VYAAGLITTYPHVIGTSLTVDFVMAPVLLFYARSLMEPDRPFVRADLVHLAPFIASTLMLVPFFALSGEAKLLATKDELPLSFQLIIAAKVIVAAAYITVIIRALHRFVKAADNPRSRDASVVFLYRAMLGLAGMAIASVVLSLLPSAGVHAPLDSDTLGMLFICGSIFAISTLLSRHPIARIVAQGAPLAHFVAPSTLRRKYETSPLSEADKQECLDRLVNHMTSNKPYLDMSLDLQTLADAIRVRPAHLSQVLNERLGQSFYDLVSSYRVKEAQARLADPAHSDKTLIAIAHESGFNSKASFNRAFKRVTGQTPSEYARAVCHPARSEG